MVVSMTAVGPVGTGRLDLAGGAGGVGKLGGGSGLGLCGYAEGQDECERTKHHAGYDSNKQAIADGGLEQCRPLQSDGSKS